MVYVRAYATVKTYRVCLLLLVRLLKRRNAVRKHQGSIRFISSFMTIQKLKPNTKLSNVFHKRVSHTSE
jgi:hypothetical protein